ncbi:MAG TPA: type II toxin-antitoxin system RelE/ParE family toxin [Pirellulales bacterium]|nr:type II toxin-antitoxin system RelE/ParE family toxin [Pirellulales bacterium]
MKSVEVSQRAERDLEEIHDYIAHDKPGAATKLVKTIEKKFETLARFPELGSRCDYIGTGLRLTSCGTYVIIYSVTPAGVEIARVVQGNRDLPWALGD